MTSGVPSFGPGTVVAERYRIEAKLGEGGYGAVYSAVQLGMDRKVALKLLHPDVLSRKTALERFLREARLAQQLSHPNVVRLLDYGTTREGAPFIAFELLSGRSVERELAGKGALPAARVLHVAQQTLKGLMEAHGLGIVHRDIKPGNLFLCDFAGEPDFVKILDFGIAAAPNEGTRSGPLTLEGTSLGTPAYMAPEQVLDHPIDGRADLYALGLVMSEMLTGEPVYAGRGALQIAMRQADAAPVPLSAAVLGSPLGAVIARATEKSPERRFRSAFEMLEALRAVAGAVAASPDILRGVDVANAFATGPTVGIATPMTGSPAAGLRPGHVVITPPPALPPPQAASLSAQFFAPGPAAPAPARRSPWLLVVVVLAAFVLGAAGFGAFVIHRESTATNRPTRPKRIKPKRPLKSHAPTPDDETDTESADDVLDHPEKLLDGTHTGPCRPIPPAVANIRVRGIDVETMLRRLETAGYACTSRTDNDIPGARNTVFIVGDDAAWVMMVVMERGENIMGSGTGGRLVTDPNGASVAFAEPDGAKAAEVIFGK